MSEANGPDSVRVFVYFDYSCPYSYLTIPALRSLNEERPLEVVWRPLETRPEIAEEGVLAQTSENGATSGEWERLAAEAVSRGVPLHRPGLIPSTRLPLQAAEFARDLGLEAFRRLHEALFRAYFVQGDNIGTMPRLLDLAAMEGLDRTALEQALSDGRYVGELEAAETEAERYEITRTPTLLFGRFKVIGAAPQEVLRQAADMAVG